MQKIGVIADTHGLLRPEALVALQGCDHILHAGDIGKPEIIQALSQLAPLQVVRGNNDTQPWAMALPERLRLTFGGLTLYLLHDLKELEFDPLSAGIDLVIAGHSHKPSQIGRDGVLFFNPGSAGPRRFKLPVSLGLLWLEGRSARAELVTLLP